MTDPKVPGENVGKGPAWEVYVRGRGVSVPPVCACCLGKTGNTERVPTPVRLRVPGRVRAGKACVEMPICPACLDHRRAFYAQVRRVRIKSAVLGAAVMFLLLAGLKKPEWLSAGAGLAASAAAYYLFSALTRAKPLSWSHASRFRPVTVSAATRSGDAFLRDPCLSFTFAGRGYADMFMKANGAAAVEILPVKAADSVARRSLLRLNRRRIPDLVRTAAVFALCACLLILCGRYGMFGGIDLRDGLKWPSFILSLTRPDPGRGADFTAAPTRRPTAAPTRQPTARPTAAPTRRPTAAPTRRPTAKPTAVPTRKPTATPRPTATPSPMPTVSVFSGKRFITPDYEETCPLTVNAGRESNYYVYLKYIRAPARSLDARELRRDARYPYESDIAFFVSAGGTVSLDVPIGVYKLYYATGGDFYGTEYLFGKKTAAYDSDDLLTFYTSSEGGTVYSNGHTLTLYSVVNGNFDTDPIPESSFPKR